MNPSGFRIEEKKSAEGMVTNKSMRQPQPYHGGGGATTTTTTTSTSSPPEIKSSGSYKSTHSSRSSVLERAREYNRRIDEQNLRRRTKSLERGVLEGQGSAANGTSEAGGGDASATSSSYHHPYPHRQRSHSAGRVPSSSSSTGQRMSTRERAMASVRREGGLLGSNSNKNIHQGGTSTSRAAAGDAPPHTSEQYPLTPSTAYTSGTATTTATPYTPTPHHQQQPSSTNKNAAAATSSSSNRLGAKVTPHHQAHTSQAAPSLSPTSRTTASSSQPETHPSQQHLQSPSYPPQRGQPQQAGAPRAAQHPHHRPHGNNSHPAPAANAASSHRSVSAQNGKTSVAPPESRQHSHHPPPPAARDSHHNNHDDGGNGAAPAVVTPELLVDALSGHEDGLLAIAERLMEHYDAGYDVMGEAIIDAFADVQKLFQHVVEAAHMEGAAFEATRAQEEILDLKRQAASAAALGGLMMADSEMVLMELPDGGGHLAAATTSPTSPSMPPRHDEFIDQDVKDLLTEAIRKGSLLRDSNKHTECYELYDRACQAASSLLPVDSDHRGRLQLSLARAESMTADRACAILRYAMDDVLRSGMRAVRTPLPDPSQRADVVLSRPMAHPSTSGPAAVVQSSDEALQSLIDELKEILSAPVYANNASSPLQTVAKRFWAALAEAQKVQRKNEERLEQQLGKLKGDYLLAKAEWEEKLNQANERTESFKIKYERLKEATRTGNSMDSMDLQNNSFRGGSQDDHDMSAMFTVKSTPSKTGSVASFGSGLAQQAKTLVSTMNNFNCSALNERTGMTASDFRDAEVHYEARSRLHQAHASATAASAIPASVSSSAASMSPSQPPSRGRSTSASRSRSTRAFREYSKSPQRVDV